MSDVERRRNLIPRPVPVASSDWFFTGGTRALDSVFVRRPGVSTLRRTLTAASVTLVSGARMLAPEDSPIPVVEGETYTVSAYTSASVGGFRSIIDLVWLDAVGSAIPGPSGAYLTGGVVGEWQRPSVTVVAPVGAAAVRPSVTVSAAAGSTAAIGAQVWLTDGLMEVGGVLGEFFAGSSSASGAFHFSWAGAANASASIMWEGIAALTPFSDMNPVPRVLLDVPVSLFPAGAVTVSLQSTVEGRTIDVRGGVRKPVSSPLIVLDPEPAFGVPTAYTVVGYDAAGAVIGSWPLGSTVVEFEGTVIQQPLDPRLSVQVTMTAGTAATVARETPGSPAYPQGRVLPGVVGLGPRRGVGGVALEILTESNEDADALQATLGGYDKPQLPIWLIRSPGGSNRLPRRFFCHVPKLDEKDRDPGSDDPIVQFSATVTEVRPPAAGITAAVLTHSDMKVFFSTHTEVKAQYATHTDVLRDTSLIGAADA